MFDIQKVELMWAGRKLTLETGRIARQADGSVLATYGEIKDLVRLGAYRAGHDPEADAAVQLAPRIEAVLRQRKGEISHVEQSFAALAEAIDGA